MGKQLTLKEYKDFINNRFDGKVVILAESYGTRKTKMLTQCTICGNTWETCPDTLMRAKYGCPECAKTIQLNQLNMGISKGSLKIKSLLDKHNIIYSVEFSFNDLIGKEHPLRFDFAILDGLTIKGLIEFNGKQHYEASTGIFDEEYLMKIQENDKKKIDYCKKRNIPLKIIRYDEINSIKIEDLTF